jgi:hypothetical protein
MLVLPCRFLSCLFSDCGRDSLEQFPSCVVQRHGGIIVAHPVCLCIQLLNGDAGFEILTGMGKDFNFS